MRHRKLSAVSAEWPGSPEPPLDRGGGSAPALTERLNRPRQLFHAPLRHAVVTVLIEVILDAGLLRHRYDPGGVSGAAKSDHERQLVRRGDAQQLAQGGLVDGAQIGRASCRERV